MVPSFVDALVPIEQGTRGPMDQGGMERW
jgi:hypothetical protein